MRLTELSIIQDVLVEENNTGTQGNPNTVALLALLLLLLGYIYIYVCSRHVDGRVEGRLGRFGLVGGGVDSRQTRLRTRDLTRLSGLFTFVAHDGRGNGSGLMRDEVLEIKGTRP